MSQLLQQAASLCGTCLTVSTQTFTYKQPDVVRYAGIVLSNCQHLSAHALETSALHLQLPKGRIEQRR